MSAAHPAPVNVSPLIRVSLYSFEPLNCGLVCNFLLFKMIDMTGKPVTSRYDDSDCHCFQVFSACINFKSRKTLVLKDFLTYQPGRTALLETPS